MKMKPKRTKTSMITLALALLVAAPHGAALAAAGEAEADLRIDARPPVDQTRTTAAAGAFLPFSQPAAVEGQRAYAFGLGGYDTARDASTFEASTEVRLWGPVALRAGAVYTNASRTLRPTVGARAQLLQQGHHGVDAALGVFYRPEGLTEPEGEIESIVSVGRRVGATYLLGNLAYGQDPEGNERDGEVRLAALRGVGARVLVGLDSRLRFDLGSSAAKLAMHHEATLDALAGPSAAVFIGPVALLAHAGGSAVRFQGTGIQYGVFAMAGAGTAF